MSRWGEGYKPKWTKEYEREYSREYHRKWRLTHIEQVHASQKRCREKSNKYANQRNQEIRGEVLTHYGKGKLACVHCGFNDTRALSLDHIEGDGKIRRDSGELTGVALYRRLKNLGYPIGYQTLCMNCQWIKRVENHEEGGTKPSGFEVKE